MALPMLDMSELVFESTPKAHAVSAGPMCNMAIDGVVKGGHTAAVVQSQALGGLGQDSGRGLA